MAQKKKETHDASNSVMQDETNRASMWIVFAGVFMITIPICLYFLARFVSFENSGTLGDTIGGITAPISGLLGAYLVFLALKAQVKANEKIQEQIDVQDEKDLNHRSISRIERLIDHFGQSIDKVTYHQRGGLDARGTMDFFGPEGIKKFISDFTVGSETFSEDPSSSPIFLTLNSVLINGLYIIDQIMKSNIHIEDKKYFINTLSLHFYPKVYGPLEQIITQQDYSITATKKSVRSIVQLLSDVHLKLEAASEELF